MKVRITKAPQGLSTGDQQGYGLYRNERFVSGQDTTKEDEGSARNVYPEVDREDATIEAEKGELIITPGMERLMKIGGKKHSKGGTPIYAQGGEYVVSDYITGPDMIKDALGFESGSKKKKDNTWAKLLQKKVDPKDYNRNMEIMEQAAAGKEVDPFELAAAKNRIPDYQKYISKAALGNELSKAFVGKPFEIPQVGMPAMEALMGSSRAEAEDNPMVEMKYGGLTQYKEGDPVPEKIKKEELSKYLAQGYKKIGDRLYERVIPGQAAKTIVVEGQGPAAGRFKLQPAQPYFKTLIPQGYTYEQEIASKRIKDTPEHRKLWEQMGGKFRNEVKINAIGEKRDRITYDEAPDEGTPPQGGTPPKKDTPPTTVPKPGTPEFNNNTRKFGRLPYVQDVISTGTALANYFDREDYAPTRYRANPVYMNAPFVTTDAVDNLLMSQANTAAQEANAYGRGAQMQNATLADIRSRAIPDAIRNRVQTNAQNVQSDLATRQYNTQIANQFGAMDAQSADMFDTKRAMFIGNKQKSRATGRTMLAGAVNQLLTNSGDTYLMNQRFPNMAFNPITYDTVFKGGYGAADIFNGGQGNPSSYNDYYQQVYNSLTNVEDKKMRADMARDQADVYFGYSGARTTQRYNPMYPGMGTQVSRTSIPANQQAQQDMYNYGGAIYPWW
jgi:hypothetical protein